MKPMLEEKVSLRSSRKNFARAPSIVRPVAFAGKSPQPIQTKILLGSFVLAALILLTLIIVLVKDVQSLKPVPHTQPTVPEPIEYCTDRSCLWEAAYLLTNMNTSVDPCTDFYHYACGNYANLYPTEDFWDSNSVKSLMEAENDKKIADSLEEPITNGVFDDAIAKAKTYFTSCIDDYQKTATGGQPLIQAIKNLGGWYALSNSGYNEADWSDVGKLNVALQHFHIDYSADPFFLITLAADWWTQPEHHPAERYIIQLRSSSLGMSLNDYLLNSTQAIFHQQGYYDFISGVIRMLWSDNQGGDPPEEIVFNTLNDIFKVETLIANITKNYNPDWNPDNAIQTLQYLVEHFTGKINWFELLYNFFPDSGLTLETPIHLYQAAYLEQIIALIGELSPRELNNYLMWKLAWKYIGDLGWEYIHLNRVWAMIKYDGYVSFVGTYNWCLLQLKNNLPYLVSAVFVQDHFVDVSYYQVNSIWRHLKAAAKAKLDDNDHLWMDNATVNEARAKYDFIADEIGYPPWLTDSDQTNAYFDQVRSTFI